MPQVAALLTACVSHVPAQRPTAAEVYNTLSALRRSPARLPVTKNTSSVASLQATVDLKIALPAPKEVCCLAEARTGLASSAARLM